MARGRMIDKRVGNSKKIAKCSERARNLWFMIYPHLDRDGRIAFDDLDDLGTEIIPYFKWSIKIIANILNELTEIGLIHLYPHKNKIAIEYPKFKDFQQGLRYERESPSEITPYGVVPETSGDFRISPENSPLSLSLSLRKIKEGRKEELPPIPKNFPLKIQDELRGMKAQIKEKERLLIDPDRIKIKQAHDGRQLTAEILKEEIETMKKEFRQKVEDYS
jgi:hypothetical protein